MAAQWPPSFADNQGYPNLGYEITYRGPQTLRTQFPDGRVYVRELSTQIIRLFLELWELNRVDTTLLMEFYRSVGLSVKFSRRTFDSEDFDNDQATVLFDVEPAVQQFAPNRNRIAVTHIETDL